MDPNLPTAAEPAQNHERGPESESTARRAEDLEEGHRQAMKQVAEVRAMLAEPIIAPPPKAVCPPITSATVRVMRSHDYCHFEVVLGTQWGVHSPDDSMLGSIIAPEQVDALRKEAARLVDKAVAQFKIAKKAAARLSEMESKSRYAHALHLSPEERSPEAKAIIKFHEDAAFARRFDYDYEDEWQDED